MIVSFVTGAPVELGLEPAESVLLAITLLVSAVGSASGRAHMILGAVHLILFAAYVVLIFD